MLKIRDKQGRLKFIWNEEDDEPLSIDEWIVKEYTKKNQQKQGDKENGTN